MGAETARPVVSATFHRIWGGRGPGGDIKGLELPTFVAFDPPVASRSTSRDGLGTERGPYAAMFIGQGIATSFNAVNLAIRGHPGPGWPHREALRQAQPARCSLVTTPTRLFPDLLAH